MWRQRAGSSSGLLYGSAEQRVGSSAVRSRLVAMRLHPRDLRFEKRNPRPKLGLRVGAEVLTREVARCIAPWPRQIGLFH
jgi:hypothetical protein